MIKGKLSDIDRMKIEKQKKAVSAGYDMDIIPSDLKTYELESQNLLTHLQSRINEFHLLLKENQTASYMVEIWKHFRKWGGIPTSITQNAKDLLSSREIENIFENSDFVLMFNQAMGDREILAKSLNISPLKNFRTQIRKWKKNLTRTLQ